MKKIITILIIVGISLGLVALVSAVINNDKKEIYPTYSYGRLNDIGQWVDTKQSIYTEEMFECIGLEIDLAFESNIYYEVYFYNSDKEYIGRSKKISADYVMEEYVRYARIVITPNWDLIDTDEKEIKWYEKMFNVYSNQLTIKVDKNQVSMCSFDYYTNEEQILDTYKFEYGMTWNEWLESDYNVNNWNIEDNNIKTGHGSYLGYKDSDGNFVKILPNEYCNSYKIIYQVY